MCDAPLECDTCNKGGDAAYSTLLAHFIDSGLRNSAAREVFNTLPSLPDFDSAGSFIRGAASAAGVEDCAWADLLDSNVLKSTLYKIESAAERCGQCKTWQL